MEHEWLPEESLNGTLANLFLRSAIITALSWQFLSNEIFGYREIYLHSQHICQLI